MTLCESGLLGLSALFFLLWSAWLAFRDRPDIRGMLAAMAAMSLTSNAFTISRMAGPFWILAGAAILSSPSPAFSASPESKASSDTKELEGHTSESGPT